MSGFHQHRKGPAPFPRAGPFLSLLRVLSFDMHDPLQGLVAMQEPQNRVTNEKTCARLTEREPEQRESIWKGTVKQKPDVAPYNECVDSDRWNGCRPETPAQRPGHPTRQQGGGTAKNDIHPAQSTEGICQQTTHKQSGYGCGHEGWQNGKSF